jgi:polysaccharide deacetylase 2 family uncharacterized protein YibQ
MNVNRVISIPDMSWLFSKTVMIFVATSFLIFGCVLGWFLHNFDDVRVIYVSKIEGEGIVSSLDKNVVLSKITQTKKAAIQQIKIAENDIEINGLKNKVNVPNEGEDAVLIEENAPLKPQEKTKKSENKMAKNEDLDDAVFDIDSVSVDVKKPEKTTNEVVYFEEEIFEPIDSIEDVEDFDEKSPEEVAIAESNFLADLEDVSIKNSINSKQLEPIDLSSKLPDVLLAPVIQNNKLARKSKKTSVKLEEVKVALLHNSSQKIDFSKNNAWKKYAVKVPNLDENKPMISIIIDDMGIDRRRTKRIVALPGPITTSFLTYSGNLKRQAVSAHNAGHELMLHVPMEPKGVGYDPGPDFLSLNMSDNELKSKISKMLNVLPNVVGINNHMGSGFTSKRHKMDVVMEELKKRGLLFVDSRTTPNTKGGASARSKKVPYALRHVFIDNVPNVKYVLKQLKKAEKIAQKGKFAVVIGHPRDATIKALQKWLPSLKGKKINLVPISEIVDYKMRVGSLH